MAAEQKRTGVLCIHGIQGSPRQFDWLIAALPGRTATENLLLPGHGGDVRTFRRSGMRQWQQCVDEAIGRMSAKCDSIVIVGHSMGCLLAIDACVRNPRKIQAMVLMACPLYLRPTLRYVRYAYRAATGKGLDDPYVAAAREANGVAASSPLAYLTCIKPYLHLLAKIPRVRRQLPKLTVPVLVIHSSRDEIVSGRSLKAFSRIPGAQSCTVPESGHFRYSDGAKDLILHSVLAFIDQG